MIVELRCLDLLQLLSRLPRSIERDLAAKLEHAVAFRDHTADNTISGGAVILIILIYLKFSGYIRGDLLRKSS
jgi:hypothetical protein